MGIEDLRVMIERASRYAEKAVADSGGIAAMWHAVTEDGRDVIMPPPKCDKDIAALLVRIVLQNINAVRVVFIDECWSVRIEGRDVDALVARAEAWIAEYGSLADFEGQQEVVSFTAEDADGYVLCGWREIIRCDGTMTLGPLVVEQPDYSEGRFVGMLEPKDTRQ